jgi:hypothetical protein
MAQGASMTTKRDYSSEIMGLIVLTTLSALSHFWYLLIAICAAMAVAGAALWISDAVLRLRGDLMERVLAPAAQGNLTAESEVSVHVSAPSWPVA